LLDSRRRDREPVPPARERTIERPADVSARPRRIRLSDGRPGQFAQHREPCL